LLADARQKLASAKGHADAGLENQAKELLAQEREKNTDANAADLGWQSVVQTEDRTVTKPGDMPIENVSIWKNSAGNEWIFGALLASLLLLLACAASAEENSLYPLAFANGEFVLFDGFHLGMSEQELTKKIPYDEAERIVYSDITYVLIYELPPKGSISGARLAFVFYDEKLSTLFIDRKYASDSEEMVPKYYAQLNDAFAKCYGPPSVVETVNLRVSKEFGSTIPDTAKYDYVWDIKDNYRIIHPALSGYLGPDSIVVVNMDADLYKDADIRELADPKGLGYMIPPGGEAFLYGIKFGMTPEEVKALEPGTLLEGQLFSFDGSLYAHPDLFGFRDMLIEYDFVSGTLKRIYYFFSMEDINQAVEDYERINRYLRAAYGMPMGNYITWKDGSKNFDRSTFQEGLLSDQLSLLWYKDTYDQKINHYIQKESWGSISGLVHYLSFTRPEPLVNAPEP